MQQPHCMHSQRSLQRSGCVSQPPRPAAAAAAAHKPSLLTARSSTTRCQAQQNNNGSGNWRSNLFANNNNSSSKSASGSRSSSPLGSVLGSVDEAELLAQQAASFQQAFQEGSLGFGFSAGGLLFPYYLGVAQALQEAGILTGSSQLAGASAGSLIVACIKAGLSFDDIQAACFELARNCRDNGTRHRLRPVLEDTLRQVLPDDVHHTVSGGIHVAITRVTPGLSPSLVSSFKDREDLIQGLLTSCHIPWYFDGSLVRSYRATPCFDGGITNFLPNVPGATTVRVCCLPRQQLAAIRNIAISPDAFTPWPYNVQQMLNWALEPADEDMLEELIQCGRRDALEWAQQTGLLALAAATTDGSSSSSSDSDSSSRYSPMSSTDGGVWLPASSSSSSSSSVLSSSEEGPVGTSLLGLVKALVSHSSKKP